MGEIYKHTSPSGKSYVGRTIFDWQRRAGVNPSSSYASSPKFHAAIKKYGWENFAHEVLEDDIFDLDILCQRETYWIVFLDTANSGYNIYDGSEFHSYSYPSLTYDNNLLSSDDLRRMYIHEGMTIRSIADETGFPMSFILSGLKINGIPSHEKGFISKAAREEITSKSWKGSDPKATCEFCEESFTPIKITQRFCSKICVGKFAYKSSWGSSDITSRSRSELSKKIQSNRMMGNKNALGSPSGGITASHNRWHVTRGKFSPNCKLCVV